MYGDDGVAGGRGLPPLRGWAVFLADFALYASNARIGSTMCTARRGLRGRNVKDAKNKVFVQIFVSTTNARVDSTICTATRELGSRWAEAVQKPKIKSPCCDAFISQQGRIILYSRCHLASRTIIRTLCGIPAYPRQLTYVTRCRILCA